MPRTFYHVTTRENAVQILADGFKDGVGRYMTSHTFSGVWLADQPLDANEGASGETVLEVQLPTGIVDEWEWIEEGKPYREWLVPAEVVNRGQVRLLEADISDEEVERLLAPRRASFAEDVAAGEMTDAAARQRLKSMEERLRRWELGE